MTFDSEQQDQNSEPDQDSELDQDSEPTMTAPAEGRPDGIRADDADPESAPGSGASTSSGGSGDETDVGERAEVGALDMFREDADDPESLAGDGDDD